MKQVMLAVVLALILMISISGCGGTTNVQRSNEQITPSQGAGNNQQPASSGTQTPTTKTANIGETLTNSKWAVSVNSVRYAHFIDEKSGSSFDIKDAAEGKVFVMIDLTIKNAGNTANTLDILFSNQMNVQDAKGYIYKYELLGPSFYLKNALTSTKLQPDSLVRGEIAFEVPENAKDLTLIFDFGLFDMAQGKFKLGDVSIKPLSEMKKEANLTVDKVNFNWIQFGSYQGSGSINSIEVTLKNTGELPIKNPKLNVVLKQGAKVIRDSSPLINIFDPIRPGKETTIDLTVVETIDTPTTYVAEVTLRDGTETTVLATATKEFLVH